MALPPRSTARSKPSTSRQQRLSPWPPHGWQRCPASPISAPSAMKTASQQPLLGKARADPADDPVQSPPAEQRPADRERHCAATCCVAGNAARVHSTPPGTFPAPKAARREGLPGENNSQALSWGESSQGHLGGETTLAIADAPVTDAPQASRVGSEVHQPRRSGHQRLDPDTLRPGACHVAHWPPAEPATASSTDGDRGSSQCRRCRLADARSSSFEQNAGRWWPPSPQIQITEGHQGIAQVVP